MFLCYRNKKFTLTLFLTQASLEKHVKELNVRIVDLETRSYASSPRHNTGTGSRRTDSRIEELTNQLQQTNKDRRESLRHRGPENASSQDSKSQLAETERQRAKAEAYENQINNMRQTMDTMVC